ncbi:MAG: hypothetical protein AB1765_09235 [Candidatus Hydrogenedentota bacterium]
MWKKNTVYFFILIITVLIVTNIPYIYGYFHQTKEKRFTGFYFFLDDCFTYLSKIEQGRRYHLLWENLYTSEYHKPRLIFTFYIFLGFLSKLSSVSSDIIYHISRFLLIIVFIIVINKFYILFFQDYSDRMSGLIVTCFSSGLGFLYPIFSDKVSINVPVDVWIPESITFMTFLHCPHIILSNILFVYILTVFLKNKPITILSRVYLIITSLCIGSMTPYVLILLIPALLIIKILNRDNLNNIGVDFFISISSGLFFCIYYFIILQTDRIINLWLAQDDLSPPNIIYILWGYSILIVLALFTLKNIRNNCYIKILWVYIIINLIFIYLPIKFHRRFLTGLHIPLSILANYGIIYIISRIREKRIIEFFLIIFPILAAGNIFFILYGVYTLNKFTYPSYINKNLLNTLKKLERLQPDYKEVSLSTIELSPYIPAFSGCKTYWGHHPQTVDHDRKKENIIKFLQHKGNFKDFLKQNSIKYLILPRDKIQGNIERYLSAQEVSLLYHSGDIYLFKLHNG